jgi:hypothetical protein
MYSEIRLAPLTTYQQFLDRVEELGFMAMSHSLDGFPSLSAETPNEIWHTGDRETDPWVWKDRAAEEKKLAYGCILGGNKGFVTRRCYPAFYAASRPSLAMQDRWLAGEISQTIWQLWQLYQRKSLLTTGEIRKEMGVSAKSGAGRVDSALVQLQKEYYLTVAGSRRKVSMAGKEFGWPNNVMDTVTHWAPEDWLAPAVNLRKVDSQEYILDCGQAIAVNLGREELAKYLGFMLH